MITRHKNIPEYPPHIFYFNFARKYLLLYVDDYIFLFTSEKKEKINLSSLSFTMPTQIQQSASVTLSTRLESYVQQVAFLRLLGPLLETPFLIVSAIQTSNFFRGQRNFVVNRYE